MTLLSRLRDRRTGRDNDGPGRLVTERFTHHLAVFDGPPIERWSAEGPAVNRLVVGLHGLGADERQFGGLLDLDPEVLYLGLRATIAYGRDGYSWYDPTLDAERIDHQPVVDRVADAVTTIQERTGVSAAATTIIGYSQAAGLAVVISARLADLAGGIVLGSAALPPGLTELGPGRPERAFVAIGTRDPFVEPDTVEALTTVWGSIPGGCTVERYEVPHVMSPAMASDVSSWLRSGPGGG